MHFDAFGYFAHLRTSLEMFEEASRATGRTRAVLDSLERGNTYVIASPREEEELLRRGMHRKCDIIRGNPADVYRTVGQRVNHGPVIFSHDFVYEAVKSAIYRKQEEFTHLIRQFPSPYDERTRSFAPYQLNPLMSPRDIKT